MTSNYQNLKPHIEKGSPFDKRREDWEEGFDEVAYHECVYGNPTFDPRGFYECKAFISKTLSQQKQELLEEILTQGHGGGNWRRIIEMKLEKLREGSISTPPLIED